MASDNYPKDMNDPRWFDREYGEKVNKPPQKWQEWLRLILGIAIAYCFLVFVGLPLYTSLLS